MVVGLKNAFELVGDLSGSFDFAVSVQCHENHECSVSDVLLDALLVDAWSAWCIFSASS